MRKTLCILFAFFAIFFSNRASSQIGLQWIAAGIPSTNFYNGEEYWGKVAVDDSGNVYETSLNIGDSAVFGSIILLNPRGGGYQTLIVKTNPSGGFVWGICTSISKCVPLSIVPDKLGSLYVLGAFNGPRLMVGNKLISKRIPVATNTYFLAKISPGGSVIWAKDVGDYSVGSYEYPVDYDFSDVCRGGLGIDTLGDIYVTGAFSDLHFHVDSTIVTNTDTIPDPFWEVYTFDFFLENLDTSGKVRWIKSFGGLGNDYSNLTAVTEVGDVVIQGYVGYDTVNFGSAKLFNTGYLAWFSHEGSLMKVVDIGLQGSPIGDMKSDPDNNVYLLGDIGDSVTMGPSTLLGQGGADMFIVKYDSSGSIAWANSAGGSGQDIGYSIALDSCRNIFVSGAMAQGINMTPGYTMSFNGHLLKQPSDSCCDPMFVAEYDNSGNYQQSIALMTGGDDVNGIAVDKKGNFYVGADYVSIQPWIIGKDTLPTTLGSEYAYIAKYQYDSIGCRNYDWAVSNVNVLPRPTSNDIEIYPNPATNELTISSSFTIKNVEITNSVGQKVYAQNCNAKLVTANIATFPPGIYFIKINGTEVRKFVKQ